MFMDVGGNILNGCSELADGKCKMLSWGELILSCITFNKTGGQKAQLCTPEHRIECMTVFQLKSVCLKESFIAYAEHQCIVDIMDFI